MPFSGGTFTKLFNWLTDPVNNSKIFNSRLDDEFGGIATGLTSAIVKDGTSTTTARIPFAAGIGLSDGTVSLPAWNFTNDPDCGAYRIGPNNIAIATGGAKVVDIGSAGVVFIGTLTSTGAASIGGALDAPTLPFRGVSVFTSSGTFTPATGVSQVFAMVWGAGGGSGGTSGGFNGAGAGGGEFAMGLVSVTAGVGISVTVGGAGAAGSATPTAGTNGGDSSFGTAITAKGGTASAAATGGINGGNGGNGGTGGTFRVLGGAGMNNTSPGGTGHGGHSYGFGGPWRDTGAAMPAVGGAGFNSGAGVGQAGGVGRVVVFW